MYAILDGLLETEQQQQGGEEHIISLHVPIISLYIGRQAHVDLTRLGSMPDAKQQANCKSSHPGGKARWPLNLAKLHKSQIAFFASGHYPRKTTQILFQIFVFFVRSYLASTYDD